MCVLYCGILYNVMYYDFSLGNKPVSLYCMLEAWWERQCGGDIIRTCQDQQVCVQVRESNKDSVAVTQPWCPLTTPPHQPPKQELMPQNETERLRWKNGARHHNVTDNWIFWRLAGVKGIIWLASVKDQHCIHEYIHHIVGMQSHNYI